MPIRTDLAALAAAGLLALTLAGCAGGSAALPAGLTARMDQPGAGLSRGEALGLVNAYRTTTGTSPLAADPGLDAQAQALAAGYAGSGTPPRLPAGAAGMRVSAGYATFAETFSGWRNSPADAAVLATPAARRAGLGVVYDAGSAYGVYWVLLLAE